VVADVRQAQVIFSMESGFFLVTYTK